MTTKRYRRTVLGGSLILLSGCLSERPDGGSETNEDDPEQRHDEEDDVPYDIPRPFVLSGEFTAESDVADGFEALPSDDARLDGRQRYRELFTRVEEVADQEREDGLTVSSQSVSPDSDEGIELRETIADIRDEMDADWHENDGWGSRWGTHYVEHDGSILMVFMEGPGTPEEDE